MADRRSQVRDPSLVLILEQERRIWQGQVRQLGVWQVLELRLEAWPEQGQRPGMTQTERELEKPLRVPHSGAQLVVLERQAEADPQGQAGQGRRLLAGVGQLLELQLL